MGSESLHVGHFMLDSSHRQWQFWCVLPDMFSMCITSIFIYRLSQTYSKSSSAEHRFFFPKPFESCQSVAPSPLKFYCAFPVHRVFPYTTESQPSTSEVTLIHYCHLILRLHSNFSNCPNNVFLAKGSCPESHVAFSCCICLASFGLEQFFSISLTFIMLTLLNVSGQ